jgi:hypothetical protein
MKATDELWSLSLELYIDFFLFFFGGGKHEYFFFFLMFRSDDVLKEVKPR